MENYSRYSASKILGISCNEDVRVLKVKINELEEENKKLKELLASRDYSINNLHKQLEVSRKAPGRKSRFDESTKLHIRELRKGGMSVNKLAEQYNCSTSVIGRIVKDIQLDLRKNSDEKIDK